MAVLVVTGADGNSAGGQLAGRQHHAENGSTLLICTLAPLQWQVQYAHCLLSGYLLYMWLAVFMRVLHSFQFVPVQTPVRRRAVCTGWEADAQTEQERQVGVGGGCNTAE